MVSKNKQLFYEILRFCVSGGASFIVDYGLMVILKEFCGINYLIATAISFTVSVILNYILCVTWAFKGVDKNNKTAIVIFFITSVVGLGLNELFMWLFVDIAHVYYMIAKIITVVLVMIWNYITKKKALQVKNKGVYEG